MRRHPYPPTSVLAATGIHALLQAAGDDGDDRHAKIHEAIDAFTGTSEVLATMVPRPRR
jgi:hypothetical protein